jgi:hypothetical protein
MKEANALLLSLHVIVSNVTISLLRASKFTNTNNYRIFRCQYDAAEFKI